MKTNTAKAVSKGLSSPLGSKLPSILTYGQELKKKKKKKKNKKKKKKNRKDYNKVKFGVDCFC